MGQLLQVVFLIAINLTCVVAQSLPGHYCSLVVSVVDEKGQETEDTVVVVDSQGNETEYTGRPGRAHFCALGILPVTIRVGKPNSCNYTVISNVPLEWQLERHVTVRKESRPCLRTPVPLPKPLCQVLIKVLGPAERRPASLVQVNAPRPQRLHPDQEGRVLALVGVGESFEATVSVGDGSRMAVATKCTLETPLIELTVRGDGR